MKKFYLIIFLLCFLAYGDEIEQASQAYKSGDYQNAIKLYQEACDKNNADACYNLGLLYYNGQGVRKNAKKANELYQKASKIHQEDCNKGDIKACRSWKRHKKRR